MTNQPRYDPAARTTGLVASARRMARQAAVIAQEIYAELKRLNQGGSSRPRRSDSRPQQIRVFKESLVQKYQQHNRCC